MNCTDQLNNYPKDLFSVSFIKTITETEVLFKKYEEYINKPIVKCCVLGNYSTGKSTLINALLKADILYEGCSGGTLCAAKCQSSSNNEEYFKIHEGYNSLDQKMKIDDIKNINFKNINYSNFAMNSNNYLDIFLNASKHEILQNFLLIDCPGFDDDNIDAISNYCKCADIIIFCFRAESGINNNDIENINKIKSKIGKFQINFIINRCDECDSIDRVEINNKLSPHLTGEYAVYFISAREEKEGMLNSERHGEFEQFQQCLQKQKSIATINYKKVYLDLICSVNELQDRLKFSSFREYQFNDEIFAKLQLEIIKLINNDTKIYYKNDIILALKEYSDKANQEISKFIIKQLIIDYNLNDGIINDKYFYKRFIRNETIPRPNFSWYEWGDKNQNIKKSFVDYLIEKNSTIQENIREHYREGVQRFLKELGDYKKELENIIKKINETSF